MLMSAFSYFFCCDKYRLVIKYITFHSHPHQATVSRRHYGYAQWALVCILSQTSSNPPCWFRTFVPVVCVFILHCRKIQKWMMQLQPVKTSNAAVVSPSLLLIDVLYSCAHLSVFLAAGWWTWAASAQRGGSGFTVLKKWPPSCSWWRSASTIRSSLSPTMRWDEEVQTWSGTLWSYSDTAVSTVDQQVELCPLLSWTVWLSLLSCVSSLRTGWRRAWHCSRRSWPTSGLKSRPSSCSSTRWIYWRRKSCPRIWSTTSLNMTVRGFVTRQNDDRRNEIPSFAVFVSFLSTRSPAGRQSRTRVHFEHVRQSQSRQEEVNLLPLHLRHRHQQHPLCLPRGQRSHPAEQPGRLQPGLKPRQHRHRRSTWERERERALLPCFPVRCCRASSWTRNSSYCRRHFTRSCLTQTSPATTSWQKRKRAALVRSRLQSGSWSWFRCSSRTRVGLGRQRSPRGLRGLTVSVSCRDTHQYVHVHYRKQSSPNQH